VCKKNYQYEAWTDRVIAKKCNGAVFGHTRYVIKLVFPTNDVPFGVSTICDYI